MGVREAWFLDRSALNCGEDWGCPIDSHLLCPLNPGVIAKWARTTGCSLGVFVGSWPWHPSTNQPCQLAPNKPSIQNLLRPTPSTHPSICPLSRHILLWSSAEVASLPQAVNISQSPSFLSYLTTTSVQFLVTLTLNQYHNLSTGLPASGLPQANPSQAPLLNLPKRYPSSLE